MSTTDKYPMNDQFDRILWIIDLMKAGERFQARVVIKELNRVAYERGCGFDYFQRLCKDMLDFFGKEVSE